MEPSPLQLEGYFAKHLDFTLRPGFEEDVEFTAPPAMQYLPSNLGEIDPVSLNVAVKGGPKDDDVTRWKFELIIKSQDSGNYPYEFNIALVGFFKVMLPEPLSNQRLINTNAISILYSTAREMLAATTSRSPLPGILLPSVSFINSPLTQPQDIAIDKKTEAKSDRAKKKPSKATAAKAKSDRAKKKPSKATAAKAKKRR